jgi:hypothetical protein
MIRATPFVALLLAAASAQAAPTVRDFQLPPSNPTPTPTPNVQGPVDVEGPVPVRPRAIETGNPTPTPTESRVTVPAPTASPTPRLPLPPRPTATQPARAGTSTGNAATPSTGGAAPTSAPASAAPVAESPPTSAGAALPTLPPAGLPDLSTAPGTSLAETDAGFALWPWLLALIVALGAAAGLYVWRQREQQFAGVPQIELPPVAPRAPAPQPAPPTSAPSPAPRPVAAVSGLALDAVPVMLSRSMMNATFAYRLTLANKGDAPLENIAVSADLVTAHTSVPMEQQVSRDDTPLPEMGRIGTIAPGEKVEIEGQVRLPLSAIRTVRQGKAQLYVPLLRVRASPAGRPASARTFVVGTLPTEGGRKLQPFRLDEMPQTYRSIGTMALD